MSSSKNLRGRFGQACLVLVVGGGALAAWAGCTRQPLPAAQGGKSAAPAAGAPALDGTMNVIVRPPERAQQPRPVEERGALPVRAEGNMSLEIQFNQPAYCYIVWFDTDGQVLPLYPWNTQSLDVTDVSQPPPLRRPAAVLQSPLIGGGWRFGPTGGMETVLLLARRTPLPPEISLASLLGAGLPVVKMRSPQEVLILTAGQNRPVETVLAADRGDEHEAAAADQPLMELVTRLSDHFELIRAVRFAHAGEST